MTFRLHDTDITCTTLHVSGITCTTIYLSLDITIVYIVPWSWYTLFSLCEIDIHDTVSGHIHWTTHYLALTLINEINEAGVTGGDCRRGNPGRCAWKGDPLWVWMPDVILLFIVTPVITCYMIPEYSKLFLPAIRIH